MGKGDYRACLQNNNHRPTHQHLHKVLLLLRPDPKIPGKPPRHHHRPVHRYQMAILVKLEHRLHQQTQTLPKTHCYSLSYATTWSL